MKKPNWLKNNVMVTKIEQESNIGGSLPKVHEIVAPQNNHDVWSTPPKLYVLTSVCRGKTDKLEPSKIIGY